jgi:hypothetical protein
MKENFFVCEVRVARRDSKDEENRQRASQPIFMRVSLTSLL